MPETESVRIDVEVGNPAAPGSRLHLADLRVNTESSLSWIPAPQLQSLGIWRQRPMQFRQASGQVIERWVGFALVQVGEIATMDDLVFAEPGDPSFVGTHTLQGLNLTVDPASAKLVDAGPVFAAVS